MGKNKPQSEIWGSTTVLAIGAVEFSLCTNPLMINPIPIKINNPKSEKIIISTKVLCHSPA